MHSQDEPHLFINSFSYAEFRRGPPKRDELGFAMAHLPIHLM